MKELVYLDAWAILGENDEASWIMNGIFTDKEAALSKMEELAKTFSTNIYSLFQCKITNSNKHEGNC